MFFIVINSQYYYDGSLIPNLVKEQQDWLDKQLKMYQRNHFTASGDDDIGPIVFQHIPWFLDDPFAQSGDYFSIPYEKRFPMLDRLIQAGQF